MGKKKNPNSNPKSGTIGFLAGGLITYALVGGVPGLIAGIVVGLGVGKILSIMGSGLDTTTHNKEDLERRRKEAEEAAAKAREEAERARRAAAAEIPLTGDKDADEVITQGVEMIKQIRAENQAIPDHLLTDRMNAICFKCDQLFRAVSDAPARAGQVRKFMNYYLPTTLKILKNYRLMEQRGVSWTEMQSVRDTAVRGLDMILTATQKQIDNLHQDNRLDISTDIDVLEQMLMRDGYTGNTPVMSSPAQEPRTAMEAQMRSSSVPVMDFPPASSETAGPSLKKPNLTKQ